MHAHSSTYRYCDPTGRQGPGDYGEHFARTQTAGHIFVLVLPVPVGFCARRAAVRRQPEIIVTFAITCVCAGATAIRKMAGVMA